MAESTEVLVHIDEVQLHEVQSGRESLREWGELLLSVHTVEGVSGLWIKVGNTEWCLDATTPALKATPHTFMFAMGSGRFYSVLLGEGTPEEEAITLEEILMECTSFDLAGVMSKQSAEAMVEDVAHDVEGDEELPVSPVAPAVAAPAAVSDNAPPSTSQRILSGATAMQERLLASANWASQKILEQSQAYQMQTEPCKRPINLSPEFLRRLKLARSVAERGNRAANRVAGGIADVSVKVADSIVRHMGPTKYGKQLNDPSARPDAAKEVAAAAVVAAVGIYDSMEQAARLVLDSGGQATSELIGHRYGVAAGDAAKDAAHASVTAGLTAMSMQKIGVRKVARRIAKRTALGLAKAHAMPGSAAGASSQQQRPGTGGVSRHHRVPGDVVMQQEAVHASQVSVGQPVEESAPAAPITEYRSPFAN